jgi:hypothetical protein
MVCLWSVSTYSLSQHVMDVSGEIHVRVDLPAGKAPHWLLHRRVSGFRSGHDAYGWWTSEFIHRNENWSRPSTSAFHLQTEWLITMEKDFCCEAETLDVSGIGTFFFELWERFATYHNACHLTVSWALRMQFSQIQPMSLISLGYFLPICC